MLVPSDLFVDHMDFHWCSHHKNNHNKVLLEQDDYMILLLTPWCRKLFEKLIIAQLVKNILLSYGTRRFIIVFTKARRWTLS
jgi:hypothetical protein